MTDQPDEIAAFDQENAMWEGWEITCDPASKDEGAHYIIKQHQTSERFKDRDAVWAFMACQTLKGSIYHATALRLIRDHTSAEWNRMVNHFRLALGVDLEALVAEASK